MKVEIVKIENRIVSCKLEDNYILDIDIRWFNQDVSVGDCYDVDISKENLVHKVVQ